MAGPELAVVDASVAAKWFLPERDSESARSLRLAHLDARASLVAPAILPYEVGNALRFHPHLGADVVGRAVAQLLDVQVRLDPPSPEALDAAVRVAFRTGLTVYDACYLALAERLDCPLYTADKRQIAADPTRVRNVRDFPEG